MNSRFRSWPRQRRDPNEGVRISACQCLVNKRAEPRLVMDLLADAVGSANEEVRFRAVWLLGRGSFHSEEVNATTTGSQTEEAAAMRKELFALLRRLLDDRSSKVRAAAISSFGGIWGRPGGGGRACRRGERQDRGVRLAAATTILRINGAEDPTAAAILCGLLAEPEPSDVRLAALNVVRLTSRKTQAQAIKTLAGMIPRVGPIVLPEVVNCLGTVGPIARLALPELDKLLDDNEPVTRAAAARAILMIEQTESPRVLAVMAVLIAEKSLPQDWRFEALEDDQAERPGCPGESLCRPDSPARRSQRRRPRHGACAPLPDYPRNCRRNAGLRREPIKTRDEATGFPRGSWAS